MSKLKVSAIHDPDNDNEAITVDTSGNVGISQTASFDGNVGIGTTSPSSNLHINNSSGDATAKIVSGSGSSWITMSNTSAAYIHNTSSTPTIFTTGGTERMRIDTSGRVTMPYQPGFRAGCDTNTSLSAGDTYIFNTTSNLGGFNTGNHYNTSTGVFTAPVAGKYFFYIQIIMQSVSEGQQFDDQIKLLLNGSNAAYDNRRAEYISGTTGNSGYYTTSTTAIFNLSANDTVKGIANYAGTLHGNDRFSVFHGYLLG